MATFKRTSEPRDNTRQSHKNEDTTNYLESGGFLSPGIRLAGLERSTTCGVRVKNSSTGALCITCSNYGFLVNDNVYHLDKTGTPIGQIKEQYENQDVALFEPDVIVPFKNDSYFSTAVPKRLLKEAKLRQLYGTWFEADSMSTGVVAFINSFIKANIPPRQLDDYQKIPYCHFTIEMIWNAVGTLGTKQLADRICGVPLVQCDDGSEGEDASLGGSIAGFFQLYHGGRICVTPVLDKRITDSWELL